MQKRWRQRAASRKNVIKMEFIYTVTLSLSLYSCVAEPERCFLVIIHAKQAHCRLKLENCKRTRMKQKKKLKLNPFFFYKTHITRADLFSDTTREISSEISREKLRNRRATLNSLLWVIFSFLCYSAVVVKTHTQAVVTTRVFDSEQCRNGNWH